MKSISRVKSERDIQPFEPERAAKARMKKRSEVRNAKR